MTHSVLESHSLEPSDVGAAIRSYRRIALLTEGLSDSFHAKTAISLLRYRAADVVAVVDSLEQGKNAQTLFGAGGDIPITGSLDGLDIDAVFIGIAAIGGKLPAGYREIIAGALRRSVDVVSGMHDFLSDDSEFRQIAAQNGASLIDVRKNDERETASGQPFRSGCLRVHTVGHDCTVGKMVVTLEVERELKRREIDAKFVATGQTGIMIAGEGTPIDCVVSDFVNGAAESLVRRNEQHEILLVEGQGCISHPSFSGVTAGLLHGCAPDGLIFCYEIGRTMVKGLEGIPLLPNRDLIDAYEKMASLRHPCRVIGIAMNGRNVTARQADAERERVAAEFGLPVCDVYRHGAADLADAVWQLKQERNR